MPSGQTLADLRNDAISIAGLDLSTTEANRKINEGYIELACRSTYSRATLSLGPTVANQADYTIPSSVYRILKVSINGRPLEESALEEVEQLQQANVYLRGNGVYFINFDASGTEKLSIWPVPATGGDTLSALCVVRPAELAADTDEPALPREHRAGIIDYVAAFSLGFGEDAPDARAFYESEFNRRVDELRHLRNMKQAKGRAQIKIQGIHY